MVQGFSAEVEQIRQRLDRARASSEAEVEALAQDLETALEELRVTEEEVRTQHQELSRLLEDQERARWCDERMLAGLPIPVLTTDRNGWLVSANPASADFFAVPVARLTRTPLFALVEDSFRSAARTCLSEVLRAGSPQRLPLELRVRGCPAVVTAYVAPAPLGQVGVTWMLLPDDVGDVPAAGPWAPRAGVLDAVLAILALTGQGAEPRAVVQELCDVVAAALEPGVAVTVSLGPPERAAIVASSSAEAQVVDRWQLDVGAGPGALCFESRQPVTTDRLRDDPRWGPLGADHEGSPFGGAVAVPLTPAAGSAGVLTAYLPATVLPTTELVEDVELLGAAVTSVLQELGLRADLDRLRQDMRDALASRAEIEQAKGIVMAAKRCTADEAFEHLVMLSNTGHRKLREVAHQIVTQTGG